MILQPRHLAEGATGLEAYALEFRGSQSGGANAPIAPIRYLETKYPFGVYLEQDNLGNNQSAGGLHEWAIALTGTPVVAPPTLDGDFMWLKEVPLENDPTPGWQEDDYDIWSANFGNSGSGAGSTQGVPEPSTVLLLLLAVASLCRVLDRRR